MSQDDETEELNEFDQDTLEFIIWFLQQPHTRAHDKVGLKDFRERGAGRGVVASADFQPDDELFAIPRDLVLTASTSSIPQDVLEPLKDSGSWLPLIVSIIYEFLKGKQSRWYPYFQVLPTTFDTLMFWKDYDLSWLQASAVRNKIGKASAEESWRTTIVPLMLEYYDLFPVAGDDLDTKTKELIHLAHFAGSLIMAYAFDIDRDDDRHANDHSDQEFEEDDEDEPLKGMVPFADMLNADADRNNARLFQEDDFLIMKATKPIKAGEEIFNDYGPLPRSDLLRMYGYVTDNYAQYDVVEFEHDLLVDVAGMRDPSKNQAWLKREEHLDEIGIIDDGYSLQRPPYATKLEGSLPENIRMLLRGLCLDANATGISKLDKLDSITLEEAALLSAVATKKLAEYETSLESDEALYRRLDRNGSGGAVVTKRMEMALQVRIGEKEILQLLIDLCFLHTAEKSFPSKDKKRKPENRDHATLSKKAAKRKH